VSIAGVKIAPQMLFMIEVEEVFGIEIEQFPGVLIVYSERRRDFGIPEIEFGREQFACIQTNKPEFARPIAPGQSPGWVVTMFESCAPGHDI